MFPAVSSVERTSAASDKGEQATTQFRSGTAYWFPHSSRFPVQDPRFSMFFNLKFDEVESNLIVSDLSTAITD